MTRAQGEIDEIIRQIAYVDGRLAEQEARVDLLTANAQSTDAAQLLLGEMRTVRDVLLVRFSTVSEMIRDARKNNDDAEQNGHS